MSPLSNLQTSPFFSGLDDVVMLRTLRPPPHEEVHDRSQGQGYDEDEENHAREPRGCHRHGADPELGAKLSWETGAGVEGVADAKGAQGGTALLVRGAEISVGPLFHALVLEEDHFLGPEAQGTHALAE